MTNTQTIYIVVGIKEKGQVSSPFIFFNCGRAVQFGKELVTVFGFDRFDMTEGLTPIQ